MALVSVIIPLYNAEAFLTETVQSLLAQTHQDFEVFIINDGSKDRSADVARPFLADPRFTFLEHDNHGAAYTRNRGLRAARGEYIAFLDADDLWHAEKLERQLAVFEKHPAAGVVYTQRATIDAAGAPIVGYQPKLFSGKILNELYVDNFVCMSSTLMRREIVDRIGFFDDSRQVTEDWQFWLRVACQYEFQAIEDALVQYRVHGNQLSRNVEKRVKEAWEVRAQLEETAGHLIGMSARRRARALHYSHKAFRLAEVEGPLFALKNYLKALSFWPIDAFSWRGIAKTVLPSGFVAAIRSVKAKAAGQEPVK